MEVALTEEMFYALLMMQTKILNTLARHPFSDGVVISEREVSLLEELADNLEVSLCPGTETVLLLSRRKALRLLPVLDEILYPTVEERVREANRQRTLKEQKETNSKWRT